MKKYTSVSVILLLCLTLSINSLAIGNTYTFTSSWTHSLLQNSLLVINDTDYTYTVRNIKEGYIQADGILYNGSFSNDSFCVWFESKDGPGSGNVSLTIPLNINIYTGVEYLELEFFLSYSAWVTFESATVRVGSTNLATTTTVTEYDSVDFGHLEFASASAEHGTFVSDYSGKGKLINVRYFKNLSSTAQTIDSITLNFRNTGSSFSLAMPCYNQVVTLPDSFYDAIYSIKIYERLNYNELVTLNNKITDLQGQLDEIIGSVGANSETVQNYYNTIINQDPEQAEVIAALQSELESAKAELAEMKETFNSVVHPSSDTIFSDPTLSSSSKIISNFFSDQDSQNLFSTLFTNYIFLPFLGITITLATVGYILYGKRG